jgi:hypothetical protein
MQLLQYIWYILKVLGNTVKSFLIRDMTDFHTYASTVYDIELRKVVLQIEGHHDEVNAVCFADESSNILYSGSDDTFIKVW